MHDPRQSDGDAMLPYADFGRRLLGSIFDALGVCANGLFDSEDTRYRDAIFCTNLYKAIKRGLHVYLEQPTHANSNTPQIFAKNMVKAHVFRLALLYFYQNPNKDTLRALYSTQLLKIASMTLVDEMQTFYMKIVSKTRNWYNDESNALSADVSKRSMDMFFRGLEAELGIDSDRAAMPFTLRGIDWPQYHEAPA